MELVIIRLSVLILPMSVYPARLQTPCGPGAYLCSPRVCSTWYKSLALKRWSIHAYQLKEHMLCTSGSCNLKGDDGQCHKSIRHQDSASLGPIQSTPMVDCMGVGPIHHWVWAWWRHTACSESFLCLPQLTPHIGGEKARRSIQCFKCLLKRLPHLPIEYICGLSLQAHKN